MYTIFRRVLNLIWPLGDFSEILDKYISSYFQWTTAEAYIVKVYPLIWRVKGISMSLVWIYRVSTPNSTLLSLLEIANQESISVMLFVFR